MGKLGMQCCSFGCSKQKKNVKGDLLRGDSEGSADDESRLKRKLPRSFHDFHNQPRKKAKWLKNICREDWMPSSHSRICSDHFQEKYINRTGLVAKLREDAVPTSFKNFPKHLKKKAGFYRKSKIENHQLNERPCPVDDEDSSNDVPQKPPAKRPHTVDCGENSNYVHQMQSCPDVQSTSSPNNNHDVSPRKLKKKKLKNANQKVTKLQKKLKVSQQKSRRLKTKVINSLKAITKQLQEKNLITLTCEEMLEHNFSGVPVALLKRMNLRSGKGSKYSPELKSFALTLQFYSSKAYEFVRETFNLALPHQVQVRKWFRGYVDVGNGVDEIDSSPVAKDALVLMAVAINGSWKVPCGYFFVDGLSGKERANLVKVCIKKLSDVGVNVVSLICDGPSCHFTMLQQLGACLKIENLQCYFVHPLDKTKKLYVLLDVCNMLKLVRNTLGLYGTLVDKDGGKIC
ncbi:DNA transposase THAP9 [Paramuricea clavata]|uniref:DNA transposase THAP9 n=1 Tax=Paramuricea clavata TaxID=317549 RepID=A0A6S7FI22_PARCT|nr:DNA transposase THAP9 [Paramuricea clavata]